MESVWKCICLGCKGIRDCVTGAWDSFWKLIKDDSTTKVSKTKSKGHEDGQRTVSAVLSLCLGFGAIYWLAIILFDYVFLGYFIKFLTSYLAPDDEYYYWWFCAICSFQFSLCWTVSLFLLSRILMYAWYQEVADLTCAKIGMKASNQQSLSYALSDQINSVITQSLFLVQANVVYLFPLPYYIKDSIYVFHLSLLYALYAFEYKWVQKGYGMNWRLSYVEAKWPYFFGFGLPLASVTFIVALVLPSGSYIHSICLFSTIFPFYVMSSTVTNSNRMKTFNQPLKIFKIVTVTSDFLVSGLITKVLKVIR